MFLQNDEFKLYLSLVVGISGLIALALIINNNYSIFDGITHALYQVISLMTSTGSASIDFAQWDFTAKVLLFSSMFLGACASSAGGGIKMTRWFLLFKSLKAELVRILHPNAIINIKMDGVTVAPEVIRQIIIFVIYYFIVFAFGAIVIGIIEHNATIGLSSSITAVGNIGPGFGKIIGPMGGFSSLHAVSKSIMIASMLIGRLEIIPFLVMFEPDFWNFKDN